MQFFAARLGETLENAVFLSAHGRNLDEAVLDLQFLNMKRFLFYAIKKGDRHGLAVSLKNTVWDICP